MNDEMQKQDLEEGLIRAGVFHPDEVEINETGHLSEPQKRWLALEAASWLGVAGLGMSLLAAMWAFYFQHPSGSLLLIGLTWGVVLALSAIACIQNSRSILDERRDDQVKTISGMLLKHFSYFSVGAKKISIRQESTPTCSIEIHNQLFSVSPSTYEAIVEGRSYRLFYLPKHRTLVNVVPLVNGSNKNLS